MCRKEDQPSIFKVAAVEEPWSSMRSSILKVAALEEPIPAPAAVKGPIPAVAGVEEPIPAPAAVEEPRKEDQESMLRMETAESARWSTSNILKVGAVVGVAVAVGVAAWGASKFLRLEIPPEVEEEAKDKMMKAPGRICEYIKRKDFEGSPRAYFKQLRELKKKAKLFGLDKI